MYIGQRNGASLARAVHTRQSVIELWKTSAEILQRLGATNVEVDFLFVTNFAKPDVELKEPAGLESTAPPHRNDVDMCRLMAYARARPGAMVFFLEWQLRHSTIRHSDCQRADGGDERYQDAGQPHLRFESVRRQQLIPLRLCLRKGKSAAPNTV